MDNEEKIKAIQTLLQVDPDGDAGPVTNAHFQAANGDTLKQIQAILGVGEDGAHGPVTDGAFAALSDGSGEQEPGAAPGAPQQNPVAAGGSILTLEILNRRWPKADNLIPGLREGIVNAASTVFRQYGLNSPLLIAHFMAQASEECGEGTEMMENMNYSAQGLLNTFPTHFTQKTANQFAHNPRMIGDIAYGGRMGNAPFPSNDGYNFRGAGMSQVTGREGVATLQKKLNAMGATFNILDNPQLIVSPEHTLECGVADWIDCGCLPHAAADDIVAETRALNGGLNGLDERRRQMALWKREFGL